MRLINLSAVDWLVPSQLFSILLCTKTFPYYLHCIHSFNWFMSYNAHSVNTAYTDNPFLMMGMSAMPAKVKKTMMVQEVVCIRRNIRPGLPWNVTVNFWITSYLSYYSIWDEHCCTQSQKRRKLSVKQDFCHKNFPDKTHKLHQFSNLRQICVKSMVAKF